MNVWGAVFTDLYDICNALKTPFFVKYGVQKYRNKAASWILSCSGLRYRMSDQLVMRGLDAFLPIKESRPQPCNFVSLRHVRDACSGDALRRASFEMPSLLQVTI
jgi:hypothetical protein